MRGKEQVEVGVPLASDRFPDELGEFLARDTYSLLIKGDSGTGKTTLALTILKVLQPLQNVLYISTRTSPLQLFEYYPWIEGIFGPPVPLQNSDDEKTGEGWETLVDSRLDEPNIAFERVTNVLMDKQAPTVVIDSWEALGDSMGSDALRTNLRVLETWRERAGARFIFIGEDLANIAIDYMVEGVVLLKERVASGRRLREMVLSKLHGVQIQKPSHFFTLDGGSFRSFPEYSQDDYAFRKPLAVRLDRPLQRDKGRISTGHAALDSLLGGGFALKSVALMEKGDEVDPRAGLIFVNKLVQDWAARGGEVLLQKPHGVDEAFIKQYVKSFVGGKGRLLLWDNPPRVSGVRKLKPKSRLLAVITAPERSRDEEAWGETVMALREKAELTIVQGRAGAQNEAVRVATRLKISQVEGTLFVHGEAPWTPFLGVIPGMSAGNPMMQLEPVV